MVEQDGANQRSGPLDKAAEWYGQAVALRTVVTAIPWAGGPLDVLLGARGQQIVQDRILRLLEALRREMATLSAEKVDHGYLASERVC